MSKRYKGAILSSTPPTTSASSASGVWTEQQFMQGVASGNWPALPSAPTIGTATAGAVSASVAFTAPTYVGSGIISYTATSSPGGITGTGASSPVTVSGLTAGTAYTFTVTATTAAGQGPASAASNSVTPTEPPYIEEVFSTYLYTGTGAAQTITNNIDLSTKGGMVWFKDRTVANSHRVFDTVRGTSSVITPNSTAAAFSSANMVTAFNTTGFSVGTDTTGGVNDSGDSFASWTFRKQPKFFDVVTYTGDGNLGRTVAHNLGSVPGCIIIKNTGTGGTNWGVYHRSVGATGALFLNQTYSVDTSSSYWNNTEPTSTVFTVGNQDWNNQSGQSYVAYVFAHNAGGFGLTGTDNVISCGIAANGDIVNLGYEPQWVLFKRTNGTSNWYLYDNMRGMPESGNSKVLWPNLSDAENLTVNYVSPNATGFNFASPGGTGLWIYIAIRRGPMKVPTLGTSVLDVETWSGNSSGNRNISVGFPADLNFFHVRNDVNSWNATDRLRGNGRSLQFDNTGAEINVDPDFPLFNSFQNELKVTGTGAAYINETGYNQVFFSLRRAPSFFDEVCWTGNNGSNQRVNHNLTVVPELIIYKGRNKDNYWRVYYGNINKYIALNLSNAEVSGSNLWGSSAPTTTDFGINCGSMDLDNFNAVAYLFATCAGVSKVGTYTGNGTTQTIACGFTGGARFVFIKRTDATGGWYVYDTARGMTVLTDPYLFLNSTAAESATLGSVITSTGGFTVDATILAAINTNGASYIFLAIA